MRTKLIQTNFISCPAESWLLTITCTDFSWSNGNAGVFSDRAEENAEQYQAACKSMLQTCRVKV